MSSSSQGNGWVGDKTCFEDDGDDEDDEDEDDEVPTIRSYKLKPKPEARGKRR
jgi:hypothetical protein